MGTKKAVIVGINDYAPVGAGGPDLNGCVNDARDMANTLVVCGFNPANIRILTNQNAKRANILSYLNWMLSSSVAGDSLVFFYSGHGTRVANIGADVEIDGLDEAIVPHDYLSAGLLKDDDFKSLFDAKLKPGVNLEVIFDCCHSGTGTRELVENILGLENVDYQQARVLPPMFEDEFYITYANELNGKKSKNGTKGKKTDKVSNGKKINDATDGLQVNKILVPVPGLKHTLWAACRDNQVSLEGNIAGSVRGFFTYHFCKVLRATTGNIVRKTLDKQVANALSTMGAAQINQTESIAAEFAQKIFM